MRQELQVIEGGSDTTEIWKNKCKNLIELCKSYKDENDKL